MKQKLPTYCFNFIFEIQNRNPTPSSFGVQALRKKEIKYSPL
jgi:hypothetical protein